MCIGLVSWATQERKRTKEYEKDRVRKPSRVQMYIPENDQYIGNALDMLHHSSPSKNYYQAFLDPL